MPKSKKKVQLFDDGSDDEEVKIELKTNENYAKSYNEFRKKELLSHLKHQHDDESSTSDDDASTDDEVVNPEFDREFFRTLAYLKRKDPKKYEQLPSFFDGIETVEESLKKRHQKKEKVITIKDYSRKMLLEYDGIVNEKATKAASDTRPDSPSYAEEQNRLRNELKSAILSDGEASDSEEVLGGFLQKREKDKEELQHEQEDYLKWLSGRSENVRDEVKDLEPLKQFWSSSELSRDDKFLRDYILNKRYVENESIPTYDDIVANLSEDEKELERQEQYEHHYNFRFEDPDSEYLKRYPRVIPDSVRSESNKRKEKRAERKERKEREKAIKMKELEELNALKRQELEEKLERLKEIANNEKFNLREEDLESEFDPDEHDRRMREAFDNEYYMIDEGDKKPEFPDLDKDLDIENWDDFKLMEEEKATDGDEEPHCEDDNFVMDCDYNLEREKDKKKQMQDELIESTKVRRKKRKRHSKLAEIIRTSKPVFDPDDKTYEEYLDEYYKLDYEDVIGNTPCRFKYVDTVPNDFGLTIEEILMASNKELNQWASLKKTLQNRSKQEELSDYYKYKKRAANEALKRKIFASIYGAQEDQVKDIENNEKDEPTEQIPEPIKKKKKRVKKLQNADDKLSTSMQSDFKQKQSPISLASQSSEKRKITDSNEYGVEHVMKKAKFDWTQKKKKLHDKKSKESQQKPDISENRLRAYGINPKKYFNKLKYGKQNQKCWQKPTRNGVLKGTTKN